MSISEVLRKLESSGDIVRVKAAPKRPTKRMLFLTKAAHAAHHNPNTAVNLLTGFGVVQAGFERWVEGRQVHAAYEGRRNFSVFLAKLIPPPEAVWEFRIYSGDREHARAIAIPLCQDGFLVTGIKTRSSLGKYGSPEWESALGQSQTSWAEMFPSCTPFQGAGLKDHVSENCTDVASDISW